MPRVSNEGVSIHYRVEGNGPPLVLGHGFTDSSDVWYELGCVAALKPKYRLVLIDARGHGQSDKPHDPQSHTHKKIVSDIVAVLDDLGLKTAAYWGYSMGGGSGFALARHALDRVTCFVIGGASGGAATPHPAKPGSEDPMMTALRGGPEEFIKLWGEWVTPPLRERTLANDFAALIASAEGRRLNTNGVYSKIAVPTLIYAGSNDPIHNPAQRVASAIPGAQFVSLPGLDHVAPYFRTDLVLPMVELFLAKAIAR